MIKLSDFHFKLIVFIAFAANLILRLYKIDLAPFSYDESISAKDTMLDFGHIKHEAEWDSNPPFYHYCLWIWAKLFGVTEFALRSFSVLLCSITMLIGAFFVGKNFSKTASLAFILLFSLHPVIFYYSQEARSYCLILLLSLLTMMMFKKFLDSPSLTNTLFLGILNFLLIYTHYITFYIPLFQAVIVVLVARKALKWMTLSALISFGFVFLRFTKGQFQLILGTSPKAASRDWLKKAEFSDLINFMTKMYVHYVLFILLVIYLSFFVYKYWNTLADKKKLIQYVWLLSILVPFLHFGFGLFVPIFVDRYILFSVFFSLIFLAFSVNYTKLSYTLIILMLVFGALNLKLTYVKDFDMRSVANYVRANQKNRSVIINTSDLAGLFTYYYDREQYFKMDKNGHFDLQNRKIFSASTIDDFRQLPVDMENDIMLFQGYDGGALDKEIYDYFSGKGYLLSNINGFHGLKFVLLTKQRFK